MFTKVNKICFKIISLSFQDITCLSNRHSKTAFLLEEKSRAAGVKGKTTTTTSISDFLKWGGNSDMTSKLTSCRWIYSPKTIPTRETFYLKSEFLTNILPRNIGKVGLKRTELGIQKRMRKYGVILGGILLGSWLVRMAPGQHLTPDAPH